jgi:myo-inositol-1(or 4)-monophosphatase
MPLTEKEHRIKGSGELNEMFNALGRTAAGLQRDFGEVENLQSSIKGAADFVAKAIARIEGMILSDLQLIRPQAAITTTGGHIPGDGMDEFVLGFSGAGNFVRGNPHFAVSLALKHEGETVIGLVYSPMDDRLYFAEKGRGAFIFSPFHSQRIRVSGRDALVDLTAYCDFANYKELSGIPRENIRVSGCAALDMAFVAAAKTDIMICAAPSLPEIAAGQLIVQEANGVVDWKDGDLVAANLKLKDII